MRDITFRARRTDNGEWVEGNLVWIKNLNDEPYQCFIISHLAYMEYGEFDDTYQVLAETVGQYTGLLDKDGKKIFEGDIVDITYPETIVRNALVTYVGASFYGDNGNDLWVLDDYISFEVIGNIHDNPELLEVKR